MKAGAKGASRREDKPARGQENSNRTLAKKQEKSPLFQEA